jgi:hypothetical protein
MDRERIKDRIKEFAARPKNVRYGELETLLDNHIKHLVENFNHHGKGSHHAFTVGANTFTIPDRRPFVLKVYVKNFLDAMAAIELYDPEDKP